MNRSDKQVWKTLNYMDWKKREICGGLIDYSDEQMRALKIVFL